MWACIAGACGITYFAVGVYLDARDTAIRSYISSVCKAVEDFRLQHGRYPVELEQIEHAALDYDFGIPLTSLEYVIRESEVSVSYSSNWRQTVSVSRELVED